MLFAQLGQVDRIQGRSVRLFYRLLTLGVNYARSLSSLVECNYVSEITGIGASCSVERSGQSQYEISYQPIIKGRHQLHVKVQGQHIRGSPFSVAVRSPVAVLGVILKMIT